MIYSIVSLDDIFAVQPVQSVYRQIGGGIIEIEEYGGKRRVRRLFSTNQRLYLNAQYQPYTEIIED